MKELLFLGSEISKSADFWPRLFLNPEITTISGAAMDGFHFWRRRSLLKREIILKLSLKILSKIARLKIDNKVEQKIKEKLDRSASNGRRQCPSGTPGDARDESTEHFQQNDKNK